MNKNDMKRANLGPKNKGVIPSRYILTILTFCGMSLVFSHRVCLNVAIVAMVNSSADTEFLQQEHLQSDGTHCPVPESKSNFTINIKQGTYLWSAYTQGVILASYFYLYVIAQVIGGKMTDYIGAKRLFGAATIVSSVLTCLTPTISTLGPVWLIALRVVLGFVHGMNYPAAYTLLARWAPVQERGTHLSACVIGTHAGIVLGMSLTGYLCEKEFTGGWPSAFYILGSAGFIWCVLWMYFAFDSPEEHPRISAYELGYIQRNRPFVSNAKKNVAVPWLHVIRSPGIWAVSVAKFCGAWSFLCFQTKLPAYLNEVLHMSMKKNGLVNALLFGALCISIITSGKLSDCIRGKKWFNITTIRKSFETIALLGPAGCLIAIPFAKCNTDAVVILLTSSMALFGLSGGGEVSVIVDMAPDFAGKIFGVSNAFASIPGILAPIAAGYFLEGNKGDVQQWMFIFYISIGMYLFGAVVFFLFGSAEIQPWGKCSEDDSSCQKVRTVSKKDTNLLMTVPVILNIDCPEVLKNMNITTIGSAGF